MKRLDRRRFLGLSLAAAASSGLGIGCAARPSTPLAATVGRRSATARHHIVVVLLEGGYDSLMTFDPKAQDAVGDGIDCGYRGDERVRGVERLYGPCIGGILRHESELCLVHGVRTDTVSHGEGKAMVLTGSRHHNGTRSAPIGKIIGDLLPGDAPISYLHCKPGWPSFSFPPFPGGPPDDLGTGRAGVELEDLTVRSLVDRPEVTYERPRWFDTVDALHLDEARGLMGASTRGLEDYRSAIDTSRAVHRLLADADRTTTFKSHMGPAFQLAHRAIKRNHARYLLLRSRGDWFDTHVDHVHRQRTRLAPIFEDLASFIDGLKGERDQFGSLYERTTIVVCSELGRYPKLNSTQGKDHWPENTWVLLGRGIKAGVTVGATDTQLRGAPIDFRSGSLEDGELQPIFIDSIFATLVRIAGGQPEALGFTKGSVIERICA